MKFITARLLLVIASFIALSAIPLCAQTETWNDDGADQSWSDTTNWSGGLVPGVQPYGIVSTNTVGYNVIIGTLTTSSIANPILIDTNSTSVAQGTVSIGNLTFDDTTGVEIEDLSGETLTLTGTTGITNSTTASQILNIQVTEAATGGSATYAGGPTGGSLTFAQSLDIGATNITTTGAVNMLGSLSGTGSLTIGDGSTTTTLVLAGNNHTTYSGAVTIDANGTLQLGNGGASGDPGSNATLTDNGTLIIDRSDSPTDNGTVITGSGSLLQEGTGTFTITAADNYTGGTTVNAGTLTVGTGGTLGATTGTLAVNNLNTGAGTAVVLNLSTSAGTTTGSLSGTLATPSSGTNTATINNGGQLFTVNQTSAGTFAGVIAGTGGFTLGDSSTNTLILAGANTYSGGTEISGGTLQLSGSGTLGNTSGDLEVNSGGALDLNGLSQTVGALTLGAGGSTVETSSAATLTTTGVTVNGTGNTISSNVTVVGDTNFGVNSALAVNGALTGNVTINSGTNDTLSGNGGSVSGTTDVTGGTVSGTGSGLTLTGLTTFNSTGNTLSGTVTSTDGVTVASGASVTQTGTLTGSLSNLSGLFTANGTVTANATVASGGTLGGDGTIDGTTGVTGGTINGSNLTLTGLTTFNSTGNTLSGTVTSTNGVTVASSGAVTQTGTLTGSLSNLSGLFTANGIVTSNATVVSGGTLGGDGTIDGTTGVTSGTINGSALTLTGVTTFNSTGNTLSGTETGNVALASSAVVTQSGTLTGTIALGTSATLNGSGTSTVGAVTLAGSDTLSSSATLHTGGITVSGTGNQISSGTVAGNTVLNGGSVLALANTSSLTGTVTVNSSATLDAQGTTNSVGAITLDSGGTISLQNSAINTLDGTTLTVPSGTGTISIDVGSSSGQNSDLVSLTSASLAAGSLVVNVNALTGATAGTQYNFLDASGLSATDFTSGTLSGIPALAGDTFSFSVVGDSAYVTINSASGNSYYYNGATGGSGTNFALASNFDTDATSGIAQTNAPSATSNVFIATNTPNNIDPTLGTSLTINSLTFLATGSGASLSGAGTLTINGGVTVSTGTASTETISAPVALGASQTWTVNGTSTLADSGGISGAFALTKAGSGTLALSGADTYTGATTISAGVLNIQSNSALGTGAGTSTSGVTVDSGAALQIQGGISTTTAVALTLNGTGLAGGGALENVSGTNTYSGLITLGSNATIGSDAGTLNLTNTGTITGSGFTLTLTGAGNGTIDSIIATGTGGLTMSGGGTWTLSGANTFTGNTSVTAGTLDLSNSLALQNSTVTSGGTGIVFDSSVGSDAFTFGGLSGSVNLALQNNAGTPAAVALTVGNNNSSTTYSGDLSAAGSLIKVGTGTLTLSGANGYTGATTVSAGTLQIGNGSAGLISDSSTVSVALGATLAFDEATGSTQSNAIADSGMVEGAEGTGITNTLSGAITGSGGVFTQTGTGTTVLTNTGNTYTGGTTITAGTLKIGDGATGNGSLGTGSVTDNATLVFDPLTASIIGNAITGSGTVTKIGSSATILTSTGNTYSGGTTITAGILQIGNGTTSNGSIGMGGILDNASLVFDPFSTSTITNAITGSGTVTQNGSGTTILTSSSNAYSGATTVANGTLQIGNGSTGLISNTSPVSVSLGATLAFDEANNSTQSNSIDDAGTVVGAEGSGITNTLSGAITDAGVFTQTGAGKTILTNTGNTYSGGTTITAGTLQIGDGTTGNGSLGTIGVTDNAALVFDPLASSTSTIGNAITGSGTVTQNGPGTTVLTSSSNNYSGNTTVSAGTLQIGNGTTGAISNGSVVSVSSGATLAFDEATGLTQTNAIADSGTVNGDEGSGITNTLSGDITGTGAFTQTGTGTTVLSGDNGYSGGTTISAGTLMAGSATALGATTSSLTDNATLDLDGNSVTVGALNGSGTVTNNGGSDSTLTVSGGGAFTGGIEDGTTNTTALTLTGGTLVLSGANSYSGGTTITAGTLEVESATALGAGAVSNSGTLEAGGSQHVINVATNYTQGSGGTLDITLNSLPGSNPGVNDTNDVLSVGGTATLNGNLALTVIPSGGFTPTKGQSFTVVETTGGITSAGAGFTTAIESAPGLVFTGAVANSNDDLVVTILSTQLALTSIPGVVYSPNQAAVANYISEFITSGPLFNALANIVTNNPQDLPGIQDQLSPEKFGNFAISTVFNNAAFSTELLDGYFESQRSSNGDFGASNGQIDSSGLTVVDPSIDPGLAQISSRLLAWSPAPLSHGLLSDSADPVTAGIDMKDMKPTTAPDKGYDYDVFVLGNVVLAQDFSQTDLPHADTTTGAVQIGADYRITPHLRVGAIFGYGHTDADLDDNGSKATVDSYAPGAFISYAQNGWYFNALGCYGFDNFTENRSVTFPGFSGMAQGAPNGDQIVGNLDGGYDFHVKNWTFGPLAGVQYTHMDVDSFTEEGSDPVDLQVDKVETDSLRSRLGGHVSYVFHTGNVLLTPHLDASWQHEFMNQSQGITSQFTSVGVGSFTINTPQPSRDSALIDGGLSADLNGQVSLYLDYLVQAGQSNYLGQSVQAGVKVGF